MHPKDISILDYTYKLPAEKIAFHPTHPRDSSRLLIYEHGEIRQDKYRQLPDYLPAGSCLVFNDTRVVNSRILFPKKTGAVIEIFCLEPYGKFADYDQFFAQAGSASWKCMIGKASKWKEKYLSKDLIIDGKAVELRAELIERLPDAYIVNLSWSPSDVTHGDILNVAGITPLPPYIKRAADKQDESDYQTIYSAHEGSVAAPTAGLHFTDEIMEKVHEKGIDSLFTTLHVGAGTFKPVKAETMEGHIMHDEWMVINQDFLSELKSHIGKKVISVGTTATRTLESIYWMGNKILNKPEISVAELKISQWEAYETIEQGKAKDAIKALIDWMQRQDMEQLMIETGIIITPSYKFKIISGLITNFHLPESTLLLLVAALVGDDWREVYDYALNNDFRFLSYGDGSLLLP